MTLAIDDGDVQLHHGDALAVLATMPAESVQCIVTSPPFWALRDYGTGRWEGGDESCDHAGPPAVSTSSTLKGNGHDGGGPQIKERTVPFGKVCGKCGARRVDGQIGLEATPDEWCERLVAVFRECRRVLRKDGVMWLECGDTYTSSTGRSPDRSYMDGGAQSIAGSVTTARWTPADIGLKPKDLVGAPWMLAFALRADGWYLRSDTIWARPNPMPESVTDRPTKAHSYVFLLTKSARYFYDADAIREPSKRAGEIPGGNRQGVNEYGVNGGYAHGEVPAMANARSVWSIATEPTPFAHFATFPQALVERCIKAGTSEHGACSACGTPWTRTTERTLENPGNRSNNGKIERSSEMPAYDARREVRVETTGWSASCDCNAAVVPCVCLDPFMGSGTTALVARRLGRHAVGVELNEEYLGIAWKRLDQLSLFAP